MQPMLPQPPRPTEVPDIPFWNDPNYSGTGPHRIDWGYSDEASKDFDSDHFATSGYQTFLATEVIYDRVYEYKPDVLLVLLGYNDLAWICDKWNNFECEDTDLPNRLLASMEKLVFEARRANPQLRLGIGNIVHRTMFRKDIARNTITYNELLREAVLRWSTPDSPIHYVDVASIYSCGPDVPCPAGFDGLHPSRFGEYQIAHAFSKVMVEQLSIGRPPLVQIPPLDSLPTRTMPPPENIVAKGAPMGIQLTWDRKYGITIYEAAWRKQGTTAWEAYKQFRNMTTTVLPEAGLTYEYRLRACYGYDCSDEWSEIISATSERTTAPPPSDIRTRATATGFDISWSPPAGSWNISQYEIIYGYPGALFGMGRIGSYGSNGTITGLQSGEIKSVKMATWTDPEGGSIYQDARPIVVGGGEPESPISLQLHYDSDNVVATWQPSKGAAGYEIFYEAEPPGRNGMVWSTPLLAYITQQTLAISAFVGEQRTICVRAVNGELESTPTCAGIGQPSLSNYSPQDQYTRSFVYWGAVFAALLMLIMYMLSQKFSRTRPKISRKSSERI